MTDTPETPTPVRRRGGWPKGMKRKPMMAATPQAAPIARTLPKMRAKPNWLDMLDDGGDAVDRLYIPRSMIPEGMDMTWVTEEVWERPFYDVRAAFEKGGWTPVYADDFDGQFDGYFTPKGDQKEIKVGGLVLMARPLDISIRARAKMAREAIAPSLRMRQSIIGGEIPGVTGANHPAARAQNVAKSEFGPGYIPDQPLTYKD